MWNLFKWLSPKRTGRKPNNSYEYLSETQRRAERVAQAQEKAASKGKIQEIAETAAILSTSRHRNKYIRLSLGLPKAQSKRPDCVCQNLVDHLLKCKSRKPFWREGKRVESLA